MNIANESPSASLPPFNRTGPYRWGNGDIGVEGDVGPYQIAVRWNWLGQEPKRNGESYAMIQVCRADGGSVFDWRDLQQIKNRVLDDEWEAVEVFPAESRLKDPSNARYLWACSGRLPFGLPGGRIVLDASEAIAPQRPFQTTREAAEKARGA